MEEEEPFHRVRIRILPLKMPSVLGLELSQVFFSLVHSVLLVSGSDRSLSFSIVPGTHGFRHRYKFLHLLPFRKGQSKQDFHNKSMEARGVKSLSTKSGLSLSTCRHPMVDKYYLDYWGFLHESSTSTPVVFLFFCNIVYAEELIPFIHLMAIAIRETTLIVFRI